MANLLVSQFVTDRKLSRLSFVRSFSGVSLAQSISREKGDGSTHRTKPHVPTISTAGKVDGKQSQDQINPIVRSQQNAVGPLHGRKLF
jgi:hypothetical protein